MRHGSGFIFAVLVLLTIGPLDALAQVDFEGKSGRACSIKGFSAPVPDALWHQMRGRSWHPHMGCPQRNELAYLRIPFNDFHGRAQLGEMIVARSQAAPVLEAFADIFCAGTFRIHKMRLVWHYDGDDIRSMNDNNSSAFNCRRTTSGRRLSEHSFGKAIDLNPVQNPYVKGKFTSPRAGRSFDRPRERRRGQRGLIKRGDVVTRAFAHIGWKWAGVWRHSKDYQHFSRSGR